MFASVLVPPGQCRYKVIRELGAGGLGTVDEIEVFLSNNSLPTGSHWARKRLNAKFKDHPEARARFEREIQTIRRMTHASIVSYQGENVSGSTERFYLMPLYQSTLRHLIASNPQGFNWQSVAMYGARIADALSYAHQMGSIHRDIKPENILLDGQNNPVIADWGLGYFIHKESKVLQNLTRGGGLGTEYYCSLEQWNTGKCTATGDVYSLGMTLAELVLGQQSSIIVGMGIRQDILVRDTTGAAMMNDIIQFMTHPFPQNRYQSMAVVAQMLRAAVVQG